MKYTTLLVWITLGLLWYANGEAPDLLSVEEAAKLKYACPEEGNYCIPRLFCPLRNLTYDRETFQFLLKKQFKDEFGCGAVGPTFTYVCCSTLERIETTFSPSSTLWFYPGTDANRASGTNRSSPYPALLLWPGYSNKDKAPKSIDGTPLLSEDDKVMMGTREVQSREPVEDDAEVPEFWAPSPGFFMPSFQMLPAAGFLPFTFLPPFLLQSSLLNPFAGWNHQGSHFFGHQSVQMISPEGSHSESLLFLPDGSTQKTVVDQPKRLNQQRQRGEQRSSFLDSLFEELGLEPSAFGSKKSVLKEKHRSRRAVQSYPKPAAASGGYWKGPNDTEDDTKELSSRMQLPKANDLWGMPVGSREPQVYPLPIQMNVNNDQCGSSAESGVNVRILPGRSVEGSILAETTFGEYPWHVAILNGLSGDYLCGGAIISARFVLTVAHCVRRYQFSLLFVRVGDWDLQSSNEMLPSYDVEVAQVTVHQDFYAGNLQNDIALLRLKYPLDFQYMPHVGTVCLPPSVEVDYSDCIVTGWGQQVATNQAVGDDRANSRILQRSSQHLVAPQVCQESLRPYLGRFYQFPKRGFLCAYDIDGKDACFGDGGGALVCRIKDPDYPRRSRYHAVGLVSWGVGCGLPNVPSAYTAVWEYLDWIQSIVTRFDPYQDFSNGLIAGRAAKAKANQETVAQPAVAEAPTAPPAAPKSPVPSDVIDLAFHPRDF